MTCTISRHEILITNPHPQDITDFFLLKISMLKNIVNDRRKYKSSLVITNSF